jgi:alpha-beta hydrolase superfamily lysophospholipase
MVLKKSGKKSPFEEPALNEVKGSQRDVLKYSSLLIVVYVLLLLLSGCGVFIKRPRYIKTNEPKIEVNGNYFRYWDSSRNFFKQNISPNSDIIIICVPGLGGHGGSYDNFQEYFMRNNVSSVEIDIRGFGHWQGDKGDIRNMGLHMSDLNQVVDYYRMNFTDKKIILLGESYGSSLSLWYSSLYPQKVDGLILTSLVTKHKATDVGFKTVVNLIIGFIFFPYKPVPLGADPNEYSNDPVFRKWALKTDTLSTKGISPRYLAQAKRVIEDSYKYLCRFEKPILLLQGGKDILSDKRKIEQISNNCTSGKIRYEFFPDCFHSLVNDLNREDVFRTIMEWINETKDFK